MIDVRIESAPNSSFGIVSTKVASVNSFRNSKFRLVRISIRHAVNVHWITTFSVFLFHKKIISQLSTTSLLTSINPLKNKQSCRLPLNQTPKTFLVGAWLQPWPLPPLRLRWNPSNAFRRPVSPGHRISQHREQRIRFAWRRMPKTKLPN